MSPKKLMPRQIFVKIGLPGYTGLPGYGGLKGYGYGGLL